MEEQIFFKTTERSFTKIYGVCLKNVLREEKLSGLLRITLSKHNVMIFEV